MHILALAVILIPETPELLIEVHAEKKGFVHVWNVSPCFQEGMSFKIPA